MLDICNFLTVSFKGSCAGIEIEQCGKYHDSLKDFTLVLEPHQVPPLKDWIMSNITSMPEHCVKTLENRPETTFGFLLRCSHLENATSEFVEDAGGIQQFLDKYAIAAPNDSETQTETPADVIALNASDAECDAAQEEQAEATSEETPAPAAEEPVMEEQTAKELAAEEQTAEETPTIQYHKIEVRNVMEYDPGLIEAISDGQISESLVKLQELDARIALGGLNPACVLTDKDLEVIYNKLNKYPAELFKAFMLAYLKSVISETERYRISAVVDDLVHFMGVTANEQ